MSQQIAIAVLIVALPVTASGAVRTFTDHKGNEVKAELTGVKDGMVVLKDRGTRRLYPLGAFSLDDREFVLDWLKDKNQPDAIRELMSYAKKNTKPRAEADAEAGPPRETAGGRFGGRMLPVREDPFERGAGRTPKSSTVKIEPADVDMNLKEMYGLKLPTDELMTVPVARNWTDLAGETLLASFEQVVEPGLAVLRVSVVQTQQVPLVNLVREDIEHIQAALRTDLETIVFPETETLEPPTSVERANGVRLWRDRRDQRLFGAYKGRSERDVTIEVAGVDQTFPFHGLSRPDRLWVELEDKRRAAGSGPAAAGRQGDGAQGAAGAAGQPGRNGNQRPAGMGTGLPPASETASAAPAMSLPVYQFRCDKCGHSWTREGVQMDNCPKCAANGGDDSSGHGTGRLIGKAIGLLMSLCGIGWGINKARS